MADYPNARDCEHGHKRGKCERCDDAETIAELRAEVERLRRAIRVHEDNSEANHVFRVRCENDPISVGQPKEPGWAQAKE